MDFDKSIDGFRFSTHGDELPLKAFNFEDVTTPLTTKKKPARLENTHADDTQVPNKSERIAVPQKRSDRAHKHSNKARVPGRRMKRKKVKRSAPAYPSTVCPTSVRAVGSGSMAVQFKTLVANICENELTTLREHFKEHPFLVEAMTKVCAGFADQVHQRMVEEMQTPKKKCQQLTADGLRVNSKNVRLRRKRSEIQKLIQQYQDEATAWETAKTTALETLAHLTTKNGDISSTESETALENDQFLSEDGSATTTQNMLKQAKNISLQADCIERAVVAADTFASDYKRGHSQLVHAFQTQTRDTYGDVSNARQIVAQLIRA